MAIYHFHAKFIKRSNGSSAVSAAAYRSASRLYDERRDRHYDFTKKIGVVHSEILTPEGQEDAAVDRGCLWNAVEAREVRRNARVASEITFALPRELGREEGVRLARDFVQTEMTRPGMIADLNIHWDPSKGALPQPHAHVLLTTRRLLSSSAPDQGNRPDLVFGLKERAWTHRDQVIRWRETLAEHLNVRLAELGYEIHLDHRSFEARGIALEPQKKIGAAAARRHRQGLPADRIVQNEDIASRNGDRIISDPAVALQALTKQLPTFTRQDLRQFLERHSDDPRQFQTALAVVLQSAEIRRLGRDRAGLERFTSVDILRSEARMELTADRIAASAAGFRPRGENVLADVALALLLAAPGPGRDAAIARAGAVWEERRFRVQGFAPEQSMADRLSALARCPVRRLPFVERSPGEAILDHADLLLIDGGGLLRTPQLQAILSRAELSGARVVVMAAPETADRLKTGAPFRALVDRHGVFAAAAGAVDGRLERRAADLTSDDLQRQTDDPAFFDGGAYLRRFAERRGIEGRLRAERSLAGPAPEPGRDHRQPAAVTGWDERDVHRAVRVYAAAVLEARAGFDAGRLPTERERRSLGRAADRIGSLWRGAKEALDAAGLADPEHLKAAAAGATQSLLTAMEARQERRREEQVLERWRRGPSQRALEI